MKRNELTWAVAADAIILGLVAYWFAIAEPERVFLVGHLNAGALDVITRGRYWMAGLVASGLVLCLSTLTLAILGIAHRNQPNKSGPSWLHMWLYATPLLAGGIPAIILLGGKPSVPPVDVLGCTLLALGGTALAAAVSVMAYRDLRLLFRQALVSVGIAPVLLVGQIIELPGWRSTTPLTAGIMVVACLCVGPLWAWLLRNSCRKLGACRSPWPLYLGIVTIGYLVTPVAHHLLLTPPGYHYITAASNFFASKWWLVLLTFLLTLLQAMWMNHIMNAAPRSKNEAT